MLLELQALLCSDQQYQAVKDAKSETAGQGGATEDDESQLD